MRYGIRDKTDGTWIGSNDGPALFDEKDHGVMALGFARIAAQTLECRVFGTDLDCKFEAVEFPEGPVRKKEDIPTVMDGLAALKRLEGEDE